MKPEEEIVALKAATREAHEAIRGLREAMRDAKALHKELRGIADLEARTVMEAAVKTQLAELATETKKAIDSAVDRVHSQFEELGQLFLGTDKKSRRQGDPPLREIVERAAERRQL